MTIPSIDHRGWPVLLDEEVKPEEEAASPNVSLPPSTRPASVTYTEWARRQDLVRDAARELEDLSEQDLRERFRGLSTRQLTAADLSQLKVDVRAAFLDDLLDMLDYDERASQRARRTLRVRAPRGYAKRALKRLDDTEAAQLGTRLRARGLTDEHMTSVAKRLPESARSSFTGSKAELLSLPPMHQPPEPTPGIKSVAQPPNDQGEQQRVRFDFNRDEATGVVHSVTRIVEC